MNSERSINWQVNAIPTLGTDRFWPLLAQTVEGYLPVDSLVIMLYADDQAPQIMLNRVKEKEHRAFERVYLRGAYLLSPLYLAHRRRTYGAYSLSELVPEGFFDSEYYHTYYCQAGLSDQFVNLQAATEGRTLVISVGRLQGTYDRETLAKFQAELPIFEALMAKHLTLSQSQSQPLDQQLQSAFEAFGSSALTPREQAVVKALMQGHCSKSSARLLNISVDTERSYRKSAYAKLGVNSQSSLFHLLFQSLKVADEANGGDPLLALSKSSFPI